MASRAKLIQEFLDGRQTARRIRAENAKLRKHLGYVAYPDPGPPKPVSPRVHAPWTCATPRCWNETILLHCPRCRSQVGAR